jgi:hypothetical protein
MEIGVKELGPQFYSYQTEWMGKSYTQTAWYDPNSVVETWLNLAFADKAGPDVFVKQRLSFVELAFRQREEQVGENTSGEPQRIIVAHQINAKRTKHGVSSAVDEMIKRVKAETQHVNEVFAANVRELNTRFEQAGMPLHYHNGFIQIKADEQVQVQIEQPFWSLVKDPKWKNVSIDMAEAIDRRDTNGRDPALYAAKALESAIKIISADKGWTTGTEKGASDFLNHLEKKANGPFVEPWERQLMQRFFSDVRNELGHGPGGEPMPNLSAQQTDFAIEFCMSWVKSLINRL